jgi:hypothetical protein
MSSDHIKITVRQYVLILDECVAGVRRKTVKCLMMLSLY